MARSLIVLAVASVALLVTAACQVPRCPPPADPVLSVGCQPASPLLTLDRGDWMVGQRTGVWKVLEARENRPPEPIGYLVERRYRQLRGGPEYAMYEVTTLNRRETIGRIDPLGRTWRYAPRRNAGFEEVDEGVQAREVGVAAIFQTKRAVTLEPTSERRLAFELLDRDGSGALEPAEVQAHGDRIAGADRNGDGLIDFPEFDAIPTL